MSDGMVQYNIVNTETGLVEAGPYLFDEARDKLAEAREKLREQAKDTHAYTSTNLKLSRSVDADTDRTD